MNKIDSKPINRLILVGNGFDLAHGMKTSYRDFILWYFQQCWDAALDTNNPNPNNPKFVQYSNTLLTIEYDRSIKQSHLPKLEFKNLHEIEDIVSSPKQVGSTNPIEIKLNTKFFNAIIKGLNNKIWVDIENTYYDELKKIIKAYNTNALPSISHLVSSLQELNDHFDILKKELEKYLLTLARTEENDATRKFINELPIKDEETNQLFSLENTLILNFNYTDTTSHYLGDKTDIIHIHGQLDKVENPIIFGYGDERDETYELLEKANIPEVFTHIKSFDYLKTDNYSRLLAFLGSKYDVYIMGHSCGLSDRTLLSTIFEHENCRFIKIFYHDNAENYRKTTYEISRHFKDKAEMRSKVLNFEVCKPMPQSKPDVES